MYTKEYGDLSFINNNNNHQETASTVKVQVPLLKIYPHRTDRLFVEGAQVRTAKVQGATDEALGGRVCRTTDSRDGDEHGKFERVWVFSPWCSGPNLMASSTAACLFLSNESCRGREAKHCG